MRVFLAAALLFVQSDWKEFSIGPAVERSHRQPSDISRGMLHSNSISLRSLIAIASAMPPMRILGPESIDSERYAIDAELPVPGLQTRSEDGVAPGAQFRSLLAKELASRFHLEYHRETRQDPVYTLHLSERRKLKPGATAFPAFCTRLQEYLKAPVIPDDSLPAGPWGLRLTVETTNPDSLATALRNHLGLELIEEESNQVYLVIDRVEMPSWKQAP